MIGLTRWVETFPPTSFDKLMTGFDKALLSVAEGLRANGKVSSDPYREVITDHILSVYCPSAGSAFAEVALPVSEISLAPGAAVF